ncbi:hypothetical protein FE249_19430 (plasmid) [Acidiphilium multivorum]|uniref:hypothetical protein n=1 Tax=Acidiphilium multivorum TaxID=62140 RepID=UPI001F4C19B7|nr:hypothetical protein [Acidiphilium multivorum]UNC16385.1 hypothetical protein FE249_19430 [Acidiphilium multivorum]
MIDGQEYDVAAEIRIPLIEGAFFAARDRLASELATSGFDPHVAAAGANQIGEAILESPTQNEDATWLIAAMAPAGIARRLAGNDARNTRAALIRDGIAPDIARAVVQIAPASPRGPQTALPQLTRVADAMRVGMDAVVEAMRGRLVDSLAARGIVPKVAREISAALPKAAMRADLHLSEAIANQAAYVLETHPKLGAMSAVHGVIAYRRLGESAAMNQLIHDLRYAPAVAAAPEPMPAGVMEAIELSQRAVDANLASANRVFVEALDDSPKPGS